MCEHGPRKNRGDRLREQVDRLIDGKSMASWAAREYLELTAGCTLGAAFLRISELMLEAAEMPGGASEQRQRLILRAGQCLRIQ